MAKKATQTEAQGESKDEFGYEDTAKEDLKCTWCTDKTITKGSRYYMGTDSYAKGPFCNSEEAASRYLVASSVL